MGYISQKFIVQGLLVLLLSVHCAAGEDYDWKDYDEKEYILTPRRKNFSEAKKCCENKDAKLYAPESGDEYDFILERINRDKLETWVAVVCTDGQWKYEDGGELTWTHWGPAGASCTNATRHVATEWDNGAQGYWTVVDARLEKRYICERDEDSVWKYLVPGLAIVGGIIILGAVICVFACLCPCC